MIASPRFSPFVVGRSLRYLSKMHRACAVVFTLSVLP
jgi:hypothetical protein